jgi:hypothetical protein
LLLLLSSSLFDYHVFICLGFVTPLRGNDKGFAVHHTINTFQKGCSRYSGNG